MKKNIIRTFVIVMIISITSATLLTANAADLKSDGIQASLYISTCSSQITTGTSGKIYVDCSVNGTGIMDTIGVQTLVIQKYQSGAWVDAISWNSLYNYIAASCSVSATYNGSVGTQYRAVITFYAALGSGSDSRIMTTSSVTAAS